MWLCLRLSVNPEQPQTLNSGNPHFAVPFLPDLSVADMRTAKPLKFTEARAGDSATKRGRSFDM